MIKHGENINHLIIIIAFSYAETKSNTISIVYCEWYTSIYVIRTLFVEFV